jgi:hypothetical protein
MPFRKVCIKVTVDILNDILADIYEKFKNSKAPVYLKKHLMRIKPIFQIVNKPKWFIYGQAWALSSRSRRKDIAKRQLKLRISTHPTIIIDNKYYFLIIQINIGAQQPGITHRGLRYLVSHELAHLLQIVVDKEVNGTTSYSTSEDHNNKWRKMTRWMGGTGSITIPPYEIWA